jgi:membrane associated rhomboid family serine protease
MIPIRDDAPRYSRPYVTYLLIAINVVVFLFELTLPLEARNEFMAAYGFVPEHVTRLVAGSPLVTANVALWPVISSMFLHASWLHLIANMWVLWIFGDNIEDYLGRVFYLVLYFASGLAAALLHYLINANSAVPNVGASGAIAGIMGAYLVLYPSARVLTLIPLFVFFPLVNLPAWLVLGYWFVVQFLSGAATAIAYSSQTSGGIAFWSHIGGFLAGVSLIKLFPTRPRRYRVVRW